MDPGAPNPNGTPAPGTVAEPFPDRPTGAFLSPPQRPDELGRLGHYRILGELGRGGMGVVYRAEDTALQRPVAIKVLAPPAATDARAQARFRREAQTQAQVEHDHVVAIHSVDEVNGTPFIVMPLLKGQTLAQALKRHPQSLSEAVRIGREIAEGLAAAHAVGLIHRDIKPGNVWLEAPTGRAKLLDFGLARATDPNRAADLDQSQSVRGAVTGTPNYMSPEQARGQVVDHRTDLYSLGVVLYLMTTGRLPFAGESVIDVIAAVVIQPPRAVRDLNPDVPPPLADLIHRLLAKDPAQRPATADAVAAELLALAADLFSPTVRAVSPPGADPWADIDTQTDTEYEDEPAALLAPQTPRTGAPKWLWPAVAVGVVAVGLLVWLAMQTVGPKRRNDTAAAQPVPPPPVKPAAGAKFLKPVRTFYGPPNSDRAAALAFTPDVKETRLTAAFRTAAAPVLVQWEVPGGTEVTRVNPLAQVEVILFPPGNKSAITVNDFGQPIRMWELPQWKFLKEIGHGTTPRFWNCQLTADGDLFTSGNEGHARRFFAPDFTNATQYPLTPPDAVRAILAPDGARAVWARAHKYDSPTEGGVFVGALREPGGAVRLPRMYLGDGRPFAPDGHHFVGYQGKQLLWVATADGRTVREFAGIEGEARFWSTTVTPDGRHLVACSTGAYDGNGNWAPGSDPRMRVWDVASGAQVAYTEEYPGTAQVLAVSPDSRYVALGGYSKPAVVHLYRLPDETEPKK